MGRIKQPKRTIPEISKETLILEEYIRTKEDGTELSFEQITHETGITMNTYNKNHLRTACKRAKREYASIYGYGIKLADDKTVMPILTNRLVKIDRTVKRGEKSQKILQEQFFNSLSEQEQKNILFIGACFGAIRAAAENGKLIYQKNNPKQIPSSMTIPYHNQIHGKERYGKVG